MDKMIRIWQVGKLKYSASLKLQKFIVDMHHKKEKLSNTLLLVEHPPVYTIGIRTKNYSVEEEERLKKIGAEFYRTNRGGLITFHGPGQLVAYPIINLKNFKPSIKWYVSSIENAVIHLCSKLGIRAETSPHTGVWVNDKKICAIGIHSSRYVTSHGLALNCCTDLEWFNHIVPCGIEGKGVTSLTKELNRTVSIEETIPIFLDSFSEIFNCKYTNFPQDYAEEILSKLEIS